MNLKSLLASPSLPSPPSTAIQLLELSRKPDSAVTDYIKVIRTDPALCGKLLKAANSPLFGARSEISTVERAVPLLGITSVTALTMSFSLSDDSFAGGPLKHHYDMYWKQSVIQAVVAERIDALATRDQRAERFMAGLMLDIGKLAMLKSAPAEYVPALEVAELQKRDLVTVESETFDFSHAEAGAQLLESWRLPRRLVELIQHHHDDANMDAETGELKAIRFASAAGDYFCATCKCDALQKLNTIGNAFYGFDEQDVQEFLASIQDRIESTCELFAIDPDEISSPADLLAEANDQLVMLSLRTQQAQSEAEQQKQQLEQQNKKLREETIRDELTGLFNRRFFDETLAKEFARAQRSGRPVGILFLDIDHFKSVNDTYGHQCGDHVLTQVARSIEESSRDSDVAARYGGEEFVVLLTDAVATGIEIVAERIRSSVEKLDIEFEGEQIRTTISIGGASTTEDDSTPAGLIHRADEQTYAAKRNGRNCVQIANSLESLV